VHLKLRGWAANSGKAPWGNAWGADHGNPEACASDGEQVYIGWGGGEGAKPLLACDAQGEVRWKNIRGGLASANLVASDGTTVFAWNDVGQYATRGVYRVVARTGAYSEWSALKSTDLTLRQVFGDASDAPQRPNAMAAGAGRLFMSFSNDRVVAVDATTGEVAARVAVRKPGDLEVGPDGKLYVVSDARRVLRVDPAGGEPVEVAAAELGPRDWVSALAIGRGGEFYLGIRGDHHHVQVRGADGKALRVIGRPEGRALLGPWQRDGMLNVSGLAIDGAGQLWVAEDDGTPRRVSVWDAAGGAFKAEYFGASTYGAIGGAINPVDPALMIGQGCEWRLDPASGRATCLGTVTRDGMGASRFGSGPGGRLYLATTPGFLADGAPVRIYERLGDGDYRLRSEISRSADGKQVQVWADADGDARMQPAEVRSWPNQLQGWLQGWYMAMTPDLAFCGGFKRLAVTGWTACGAPLYDLDQARDLPAPQDGRMRGGMGAQRNHGSVDGRYVLWNGGYGEDHATLDCFDTVTGKQVWSYPSNFTGVHGSHRACSPEVGMIRGAYDIVGAAKLPDPIGNLWMVPTNKGEWHVLTERGYYLTKLFEGDPMRVAWPERAVPGADLDRCPPGAGEEAFGGSLTQGVDGRISVQAGHISFWNAEVAGLERVQALPGGSLAFSAEDVRSAGEWRQRAIRRAEGGRTLTIAKATPAFSGDLERDFAADARVSFAKQDDARVRAGLAWDATHLHVGWEVRDDTPWVNGADAPEFMYARGDTVDLQLGTDPAAPRDRGEAVLGDWRLSIGPFQGRPTAVLYRRVAAEKQPKSFHSGVVKDYVMESVVVLSDARISVAVEREKKRYVVEAAIPLAALGLAPRPGLALHGDLGATHGNAAGDDTVLRTHWCNQATGLVSDEVYELQMVPREWGVIRFGE
jgi:outer membrane protein assembly factor BamB